MMADFDLEAETDRIYQVPLGEFVAARNALADSLKSRGDREGAARVRALARPNVAAWAANQAYWTARREFDSLVLSTRRLQGAQAAGAVGAALREAVRERREALAALQKRIEPLLEGGGHKGGVETLRKVSETLAALAVGMGPPENLPARPGRLVRSLEPPGFEVLSSAPPMPESRPDATRTVPQNEDEARGAARDEARSVLSDTERALEQTRRAARDAEVALGIAERRAGGALDELDEAKRRLERAKELHDRATTDVEAARQEASRTSAARDAAEAARDAAHRLLNNFE